MNNFQLYSESLISGCCLAFGYFFPYFSLVLLTKALIVRNSIKRYDDWTSNLQLEIGFGKSWKLSLNLCSRKWLRTSLSLVINLIALGLWLLKTLADGLMNLRVLFTKILRLVEFFIFRSRLFHCIMADGKTIYIFLKLCLMLKKGTFCILLVEYSELLTGINLKRYCGSSFL